MSLLFKTLFFTLIFLSLPQFVQAKTPPWWQFQAIDTMKYSRDPSAEFLGNPERLKQVAEQQVKDIANSGATHVAIATPYDAQFSPVLVEWVAAARRHGLKVWFRGNWSGWERWFGYQLITREDHLKKTVQFIQDNAGLFEDGDYFSACPECENGGPGDPRRTGDVAGHRKFLIDEYQAELKAFRAIHKDVQVNLNSMNGDVAKLIMDKETTKALGGQVVVDHYVASPEQLNQDVTTFAELSGGRVLLGEFGAPIPDINGNMTEKQQADWIKKTTQLLAENPHLYGLSYWTNVGGSTSLWKEDGTPKLAVEAIMAAYIPSVVEGKVVNPLDQPIKATLELNSKIATTVEGNYQLPYMDYMDGTGIVHVTAEGHMPQDYHVSELLKHPNIELQVSSPGIWYRLNLWGKSVLLWMDSFI